MNTLGPLVAVEWLHGNRNNPDLIILDASIKNPIAKQEQQGEKGFIPDSVFFDLENNFSDLSSPLPHMMPTVEKFSTEARKLGINNKSIIVVYDDAGIYSSARVWWMFRSMGHEQVYVLNGGLPEWRNAGYEVSPGHKLPKGAGDFTARFNADYFSDKSAVLKAINDPDKRIIDARSAERFTGMADEPRPGLRKGHIPNSINIPFQSLLKDNKLLHSESVEKIFEKTATKDKHLIFSCGSGVTACVDALAATVAGYPLISVYDGSWSEWGIPSELPIE